MDENSISVSSLVATIEEEIKFDTPLISSILGKLFDLGLMSNEEHSRLNDATEQLSNAEYWENNFMIMIQVLEYLETDPI